MLYGFQYEKYFGILPRFIEMIPLEDGFSYSTEILDYQKFEKFGEIVGINKYEIMLWNVGDIITLGYNKLNNPELMKYIRSTKLSKLS